MKTIHFGAEAFIEDCIVTQLVAVLQQEVQTWLFMSFHCVYFVIYQI